MPIAAIIFEPSNPNERHSSTSTVTVSKPDFNITATTVSFIGSFFMSCKTSPNKLQFKMQDSKSIQPDATSKP